MLKITGVTMIFQNKAGFSTTISTSTKDEDGERTYQNEFIPISFPKGDVEEFDPQHMDKIDIKDGFLTYFYTREDVLVPKIVILEWDFAEEEPKKPTPKKQTTVKKTTKSAIDGKRQPAKKTGFEKVEEDEEEEVEKIKKTMPRNASPKKTTRK